MALKALTSLRNEEPFNICDTTVKIAKEYNFLIDTSKPRKGKYQAIQFYDILMVLRVVLMLTSQMIHVLTYEEYILKKLTQLYLRWKRVLINQATIPLRSWNIFCLKWLIERTYRLNKIL